MACWPPGPEFDRDKVVAATNAITDFTAGGLVETVDWTKAHTPFTNDTRPDDEGQECAAVVKVVDGAFETVAPPDEPWLCFPPGHRVGGARADHLRLIQTGRRDHAAGRLGR